MYRVPEIGEPDADIVGHRGAIESILDSIFGQVWSEDDEENGD